jgi:hypothetical protein
MEPRAAAVPGWRRAIRVLLSSSVLNGRPLDAAHEHFIDPAGAAALGHDVGVLACRLLAAIPAERAAALLLEAKFAKPSDLLRFVMPGLPKAVLARMAEVHVSLADDPAEKDTLMVTRLKVLGPEFGLELQNALADVNPGKAWLNALKRNLEAPVFAALEAWLTTRPAPEKKPKKKTAKK